MKQVLEENKFSIEEQMDLTKLAIPNIIPAPIEKAIPTGQNAQSNP